MTSNEMDLSAGTPPRYDEQKIQGELAEESERRRWKTYAFQGVSSLAALFSAVFLAFVLRIFIRFDGFISTNQVLVLVILGLMPCLLVISIVRMVTKPQTVNETYEFHPIVALLKELVAAFRN